MAGDRINCFAQVSPACLHGKPLSAEGDPDYRMEEDGTYVHQIDAVCCTMCYADIGAPLLADITEAIMAAKGVKVRQEEIDAQDLRPGDLWASVPLDFRNGAIGGKVYLAVRTGNLTTEEGRVYRVTIERAEV